ncbi:aminotransferase class I/II-fold pyridoxal phosphate-dependent enzyme [uncultured Polaribacter sp.]|uniref:DegT/DnrJ/EryC1/StrS family aminotransferase n=1 Tax=uncultured Polaribacter sp. TaxID=174711 RepID=UPI0026375871|nr:aminotransferase class I/II-fold pyridoxal phosphate-dependent enzyme [uncultured Polaribacter sp.]
MGGTEMKYIKQAFDTNWIAPLGENINEFENEIKNHLGSQNEVACLSSGTAALHLSLILAGVKDNDEVLCQTFTFSATINPIIYQRAIPIFIDSELDTWGMSPVYLEKAIKERIALGKKPKAIVVVHLYGMPVKIEEISKIAKAYDIVLIEDAAAAIGSSYKGQKCGTFGDFGIISFNGNKVITTSGGGALICKNKEVKERAIFLATQARDNAPHYQHSNIGYNYRLSNILAGIGRGQMEVLDSHIAKRRANHKFYKALLTDIKEVNLFKEPNENYFSNHWLSVILIKENTNFNRKELRAHLDEENIESRSLWKPMHIQPIFNSYPYYGKNIAETLFNNGLCLPSGSNLLEEDKRRISNKLKQYFITSY